MKVKVNTSEKIKPVDITFTIDTQEDADRMYSIMNCYLHYMYFNISDVEATSIRKQLQTLNPSDTYMQNHHTNTKLLAELCRIFN